MEKILSGLEWLSKYGLIDIFFGIGITGVIFGFFRKFLPTNYDLLHVNISSGGQASIPPNIVCNDSIIFNFRNAGATNFYIARAYFCPKLRRGIFLWLKKTPTRLKVHPASDRITDKDAFELKFQDQSPFFSKYEGLVRPGHSNNIQTFLALEAPLEMEDVVARKSGVLYVEYATNGKQGIHRIRV